MCYSGGPPICMKCGRSYDIKGEVAGCGCTSVYCDECLCKEVKD